MRDYEKVSTSLKPLVPALAELNLFPAIKRFGINDLEGPETYYST
jgi:hypothetical protein